MAAARITQVRLETFKSYRAQVMDLAPLTVLVGRNASGKSNALDALSLLALLADDRAVDDLERADSELAGLRGGISGAVPFGSDRLSTGCTFLLEDESTLELDLTIRVGTDSADSSNYAEILSERLSWRNRSRGRRDLDLIQAKSAGKRSGISTAQIYSGANPRSYQFLSSRLATSQVKSKVPTDAKSRQTVHDMSSLVVEALRSVFVLDPVPAQMRQYVRIGSPPDRTGANLSAVVYRLYQDDPTSWERLTGLMSRLVDSDLERVTFAEARLPGDRLVDVMVALVENFREAEQTVPADLMSDGSLRYMSIIASLLDLQGERSASEPVRTLVVEEIENGLYPSQASELLGLLRDEAERGGTQLITTTHSPAILNSLRPEDHEGIRILRRDESGETKISSLFDHPRYLEIVGSGKIGEAASVGKLVEEASRSASHVALSSLR